MQKIRLGVNIDHVATIRNARGGIHPDPIKAAILAQEYGADGITIHLREDRRHICDEDLIEIKEAIKLPLNLEMAATEEMLEIALANKPNAACIVPEKRQEVTTEGGLDVIKSERVLGPIISQLKDANIKVSLFVDADELQIKKSAEIGADIIEIHTGEFCHLHDGTHLNSESLRNIEIDQIKEREDQEFQHIAKCAKLADDLGLECHAGHGLNYETAKKIAQIPQIVELNIGHFLIGEAIFEGFAKVIAKMRGSIAR